MRVMPITLAVQNACSFGHDIERSLRFADNYTAAAQG